MSWLDRLATALMNRYRLVRVAQIVSATCLIWAVSQWSMWFAQTSLRPGMEVAAIIGAVVAPATAYGGWVFSAYAASRKGASE